VNLDFLKYFGSTLSAKACLSRITNPLPCSSQPMTSLEFSSDRISNNFDVQNTLTETCQHYNGSFFTWNRSKTIPSATIAPQQKQWSGTDNSTSTMVNFIVNRQNAYSLRKRLRQFLISVREIDISTTLFGRGSSHNKNALGGERGFLRFLPGLIRARVVCLQ
jgi:hypothetical protein